MECASHQESIQRMHDSKGVGDTHLSLALEHLAICGSCQLWFSQNMCPRMLNENTEDVRMAHGMMHEQFGDEDEECPHFK